MYVIDRQRILILPNANKKKKKKPKQSENQHPSLLSELLPVCDKTRTEAGMELAHSLLLNEEALADHRGEEAGLHL